jgi:hypothetical protein
MARVQTKTNCAIRILQGGKNAIGERVQRDATRLKPRARILAKQAA